MAVLPQSFAPQGRIRRRPRRPGQDATTVVIPVVPVPDLGGAPTLQVTARQAAVVHDVLSDSCRVHADLARRGTPVGDVVEQQTRLALEHVAPYVDHGGGLSDGLVELLELLGIVIVPLDASGDRADSA